MIRKKWLRFQNSILDPRFINNLMKRIFNNIIHSVLNNSPQFPLTLLSNQTNLQYLTLKTAQNYYHSDNNIVFNVNLINKSDQEKLQFVKIVMEQEHNQIQIRDQQSKSIDHLAAFETLISEIEVTSWKSSLTKYSRQYNLSIYKLDSVSPKNIRILYSKVTTKYQKLTDKYQRINWFQNELKIFIWLLVTYGKVNNLQIESFGTKQIDKISQPFFQINKNLCEYQLKLLTCLQNNDNWDARQNILLSQLVRKHSLEVSWTTISKLLFLESSGKFIRSAHSCRQKWQNHLDVRLIKGQWSLLDDYTIIKNVIILGKKWSSISKLFGATRTEHMVKNRFKVILKRESRQILAQTVQEVELCKIIEKKLQQTGTFPLNIGCESSTSIQSPMMKSQNQTSQKSTIQQNQLQPIKIQQKTHLEQKIKNNNKVKVKEQGTYICPQLTNRQESLQTLLQEVLKVKEKGVLSFSQNRNECPQIPFFSSEDFTNNSIDDFMQEVGFDYIF